MSKIETADFTLDSDEPTWGMTVYEDATGFCTRLVLQRPKDSGQFVGMVIHHGPDPEYMGKIPPLFIPSVEGECSVGMMLEESERHRQDLHWYQKAKAQLDGSTLFADVLRQEEEARYGAKNLSTFGPHQVTQRGGYDHEKTVRDWFEQRDENRGYKQFPVRDARSNKDDN